MKQLKKTESVKKYILPLEVIKDSGCYLASCPVWPDCYAQGKTIDEVTSEVISVASALIDLYKDESLKIPLKLEGSAKAQNKVAFDVPVFANA